MNEIDIPEKIKNNKQYQNWYSYLKNHFDNNLIFKHCDFMYEYEMAIAANDIRYIYIRDLYIQNFCFPIITDGFINSLLPYLKNKRVLDYGCGSGFLSMGLQNIDIDVEPVDNKSKKYGFGRWNKIFVDEIYNQHMLSSINDYDTIILSWPDYNSDWYTYNILNIMKKDKILIYIGEGYGGCTADDTFHDMLDSDFEEIRDKENDNTLLRFRYIHDSCYVYRKK